MSPIRFKRFIPTIIYAGILIGIIWLYRYNQPFQRNVDNLTSAAQVTINNWINPKNTQTDATSALETTSENGNESGQWTSTTATLYLDLDNQTLDQATRDAIQAWNDTGAFTFKITTNRQKADVVITTMNDSSNGVAGLTKMNINSVTHYFVNGKMYLNQAYLLSPEYNYSYQQIVNTAENELGHVIGLSHTDEISVMQPAGLLYSIQQLDIDNVKQLYNEK